MHSAPAVSFPVGRSRFVAWMTGSVIVCGFLVVSVWCLQVDALGWRQWLAATLWLMTSWLAGWHWWHTPKGNLAWDGAAWYWAVGAQALVVVPEVVLELQQLLLLRLRAPSDAHVIWIGVEQALNPLRWVALRRALYSRARRNGGDSVDALRSPVDALRRV